MVRCPCGYEVPFGRKRRAAFRQCMCFVNAVSFSIGRGGQTEWWCVDRWWLCRGVPLFRRRVRWRLTESSWGDCRAVAMRQPYNGGGNEKATVIPFCRKSVSVNRQSNHYPSSQVLSREGRDAKRNLGLARARRNGSVTDPPGQRLTKSIHWWWREFENGICILKKMYFCKIT